jgi:hypothetical protein
VSGLAVPCIRGVRPFLYGKQQKNIPKMVMCKEFYLDKLKKGKVLVWGNGK